MTQQVLIIPTWSSAMARPRYVSRIDYVFHDDAWATRAVWTGDLAGSDHRYARALLDSRRRSDA